MDYITTNNSFSWKRVGMVARFYYPRLKWQLALYPLAAFLFTLAGGYLLKAGFPAILISPFSSIASWMVYLGPLFLIIKSSREVETMLPATAKEQATCLILYAALLLPLITSIPGWAGSFVVFGTMNLTSVMSYINFPPEAKEALEYIGPELNRTSYYGVFTVVTCSLITLLTVVRAKRNRIILSIVFVIAFNFVMTIIGVIAMFSKMFSDGGVISRIQDGTPVDETTKEFIQELFPATLNVMAIFGTISIAVLIPMIYRGIKNRQA